MVDSNPNDHTAHSVEPGAPARCAKCGALPTDACAKTDAWCEDSRRRFALRDSPWVRVAEGGAAGATAAPLSADEIAEMRRIGRDIDARKKAEVLDAFASHHVTALAAIGEAFGCPPECSPQEIGDLVIKRASELQAGAFADVCAERDRLKAENVRLTAEIDDWRGAADVGDGRWMEGKPYTPAALEGRLSKHMRTESELRAALREARAQHLADLGQVLQPECCGAASSSDEAAFAAVVARQLDRALADEAAKPTETDR